MKIVDIKTQTFKYKSNQVSDSEGHGHPGPEHDATQTLLTIVDEGLQGYAFGGSRVTPLVAAPPSQSRFSSPHWLGKTHSIVKNYGNGSSTGSASIETSQTM